LLALGHRGLRTTAVSGLFYNYGFFTILAFTPFILGMDAYGIGGVFFGWGVAVAVFSVFVAPVLQNRFGATKVLTGTLLALMLTLLALGLAAGHSVPAVVVLVVISGALLGINNTIYTELAMGVSDSPRPVASSGYNFVRWMGGALAPFAAAQLGEHFGPQVPFFAGAVAMVVAIGVALGGRKYLAAHEPHVV
jgi:predicted MFS family arabinose efflux permease